jgi:fucose 4-O-acetylase-like acetyltransferase
VVIGSAVLISLGVGFFPEWSGFMGLYKTAYFLPFFILGSYCEDLSLLIKKLMRHKKLWITLLCFVMVSVMLLSFNKKTLNIINYAFKADVGYNNGFLSLIFRACSIGVSVLLCYAVLVFVNIVYNVMKHRWMGLGGGTILAFLAHEFIMIPLIRIYAHFGAIIGFLLCVITSILVTYILTRKFLVDFFSPLLDLSVLCQKLKIKVYKE